MDQEWAEFSKFMNKLPLIGGNVSFAATCSILKWVYIINLYLFYLLFLDIAWTNYVKCQSVKMTWVPGFETNEKINPKMYKSNFTAKSHYTDKRSVSSLQNKKQIITKLQDNSIIN